MLFSFGEGNDTEVFQILFMARYDLMI